MLVQDNGGIFINTNANKPRILSHGCEQAAHAAAFRKVLIRTEAGLRQEDLPRFSLSGASQTLMRARGRFILLSAGELGGHT